MKKNGELKSYECSLDGENWTNLNTTSRGSAKATFYRHYSDLGINYIDIKCRCKGKPYTSEDFKRNAKYRNIEFAYCGMVIDVNGKKGIIVGHNSSANLDVLFTEGTNKGYVINCHPNWLTTYYDSKGNVIKTFNKECRAAS